MCTARVRARTWERRTVIRRIDSVCAIEVESSAAPRRTFSRVEPRFTERRLIPAVPMPGQVSAQGSPPDQA